MSENETRGYYYCERYPDNCTSKSEEFRNAFFSTVEAAKKFLVDLGISEERLKTREDVKKGVGLFLDNNTHWNLIYEKKGKIQFTTPLMVRLFNDGSKSTQQISVW